MQTSSALVVGKAMEKFKLTGQGVIGGLAHKEGIDRLSHYIKYGPNKQVKGNKDGESIEANFKEYRESWSNQPWEWAKQINKKETSFSQFKPLSLDLELAAICDLACPYCYRQTYVTPDKVMPTQMAKDLISEAASINIASLKLNWRGEPLLHPQLCEIIRHAKEQGIVDVIINTNATHLDDSYAEKLLNSGLDYIIFSFDGGTKETYEKNRVSRFTYNQFETVCSNIKNFCKKKKEKGLKFPTQEYKWF